MPTHAHLTRENKKPAGATEAVKMRGNDEPAVQFKNNRPEARIHKELQEMVNNSLKARRLRSLQNTNDSQPQTATTASDGITAGDRSHQPHHSQTPIQRVFALDESEISNEAGKLINLSATGQAALQKGEGNLLLQSASEWKTLTKFREPGTLGIGIKAEDYSKIESASTKKLTETEQKDYSARLSHELIHLTHYQESKNDYEIMGQRDSDWGLPAWGGNQKWDSDPEEELTIKGKTTVKITQWEVMARKKYESDKHILTQEKLRLDGLIEEGKKPQASRLAKSKQTRAEREVATILADITALDGKIANPPPPKGSVVEEDCYIVTQELSENSVRKQLNLQERKMYNEQ